MLLHGTFQSEPSIQIRGLIIEWEGVRHSILFDLNQSSRLDLAKFPYQVKILRRRKHVPNQISILRFK